MDRTGKSLGGRIGGYRLAATHDPLEYTVAARDAFNRRFFAGIDDSLPPEEIARRAAAARKAYFSEMALRRHQARKPSNGAATAGVTS